MVGVSKICRREGKLMSSMSCASADFDFSDQAVTDGMTVTVRSVGVRSTVRSTAKSYQTFTVHKPMAGERASGLSGLDIFTPDFESDAARRRSSSFQFLDESHTVHLRSEVLDLSTRNKRLEWCAGYEDRTARFWEHRAYADGHFWTLGRTRSEVAAMQGARLGRTVLRKPARCPPRCPTDFFRLGTKSTRV